MPRWRLRTLAILFVPGEALANTVFALAEDPPWEGSVLLPVPTSLMQVSNT